MKGMPSPFAGAELRPATDDQPAAGSAQQAEPEGSAQQDEHRGLAARIHDLRKLVEANRRDAIRDHQALLTKVATIEQRQVALEQRVDKEVEGIQRMQRELQQTLHDGSEQVRQAGQLARKMSDGMKELEELRAVASDPHEVVRPVQKSLAQLRADVEALGRTIDIRFEQLPKGRAVPVESRGEDEEAILKLGVEIRKLKERIRALEPAN